MFDVLHDPDDLIVGSPFGIVAGGMESPPDRTLDAREKRSREGLVDHRDAVPAWLVGGRRDSFSAIVRVEPASRLHAQSHGLGIARRGEAIEHDGIRLVGTKRRRAFRPIERSPMAAEGHAGDHAGAFYSRQRRHPIFDALPERESGRGIRVGGFGQRDLETEDALRAEAGIDALHAIVGAEEQPTADEQQRGERELPPDQAAATSDGRPVGSSARWTRCAWTTGGRRGPHEAPGSSRTTGPWQPRPARQTPSRGRRRQSWPSPEPDPAPAR